MSAQQSLLTNVKPLPSRQTVPCCHSCGQKLPRLYRHRLSKGLVSGLWKLYHLHRPASICEIGLLNNEFGNFQKLRYFELIVSVDGKWSVTQRGFMFLANRVEVEKTVITRKSRVVERSNEKIRVGDIDEGWQTKLDYAREARSE